MEYTVNGGSVTIRQIREVGVLFGWDKQSGVLKIQLKPSDRNYYRFDGEAFVIEYTKIFYVFRALGELQNHRMTPFEKEENLYFERMGTMIDCSRNGVHTLKTLKKFIVILAVNGYNVLELYTEDTYRIDGEPYFGYLRGAYTKEELKELDRYAASFGIELIPCIQTLAHLGNIFRWKPYAVINDINDILLTGDEKTYDLIEKMFATTRECFQSDFINIGMDEAFLLGFGEYYRRNGAVDRIEIMFRHLKRVLQIAKKYGYTCSMWSDMYYRLAFGGYYNEDYTDFPPKLLENAPKNISLLYWDYYSKSQEHYRKILAQHKAFDNDIWLASGYWTWLGYLPNNSFSIQATEAAIRACRQENIKNILFTMWGDNGSECSIFAVLPSITVGAEYAYGNEDEEQIRVKFQNLYDISFDAFMLLEKADKIGNITDADLTDPSKYLLYNDCFAGIFDTTVSLQNGKEYGVLADELKQYASHQEWGGIFKTAECLARVLEYKATIGIVTRKAYQEFKKGKREGLEALVRRDYVVLSERLENFYAAFECLWHTEKRANAFEIANYRMGGLIARVEYCRRRLRALLDGNIACIEELEEDLLDYFGEKEYTKGLYYINEFLKISSVNNF